MIFKREEKRCKFNSGGKKSKKKNKFQMFGQQKILPKLTLMPLHLSHFKWSNYVFTLCKFALQKLQNVAKVDCNRHTNVHTSAYRNIHSKQLHG